MTGCGSGIFTAGSVLLGADYVLGIDIDEDALSNCRDNLTSIFDEDSEVSYDLLQADITNDDIFGRLHKSFDTVIMNPPFGTKVKGKWVCYESSKLWPLICFAGIDMVFLERALQLATECVYSLHKSSTREVNVVTNLG